MRRRARTHAARLFAEPGRPADAHFAHIDGASRGNPGPASYAVILRRGDGKVVFQLAKYLGQTTNNVAEYFALITALDYAAEHGIGKLRVRSDSELLVRQMQGHYKVKSASLRPLYERARKLAGRLLYFSIEHVPREQNREADELANSALDRTAATGDTRVVGKPLSWADVPEKLPPGSAPRRIRARYSHGALHTAEPLDLPDGQEVEITIHKKSGN